MVTEIQSVNNQTKDRERVWPSPKSSRRRRTSSTSKVKYLRGWRTTSSVPGRRSRTLIGLTTARPRRRFPPNLPKMGIGSPCGGAPRPRHSKAEICFSGSDWLISRFLHHPRRRHTCLPFLTELCSLQLVSAVGQHWLLLSSTPQYSIHNS